METDDGTGTFTMVSFARGRPTTPLRLAVPAEVFTPRVPTGNSYAGLDLQDKTITQGSGHMMNTNKNVGDVLG